MAKMRKLFGDMGSDYTKFDTVYEKMERVYLKILKPEKLNFHSGLEGLICWPKISF